MERHAYWTEAYRQLQASGRANKQLDELTWGYTDEAYSTFPRYLVWWAILQEIERLETRSGDSTEALREQLANAALRAETPLTTNPGLPSTAQSAMVEEREKLIHFVRSVPESRLELVEPLELRRVFGKDELLRLWVNLDARWDVKLHHYWWPMRRAHPRRTSWLSIRIGLIRERLRRSAESWRITASIGMRTPGVRRVGL